MIWTTSVWWTRRCVRKTAQPGTAGSSFSSSWYRVLCISSFCLSGLLSFTINLSLLNTMFSWIVWASILANHRPWRGLLGTSSWQLAGQQLGWCGYHFSPRDLKSGQTCGTEPLLCGLFSSSGKLSELNLIVGRAVGVGELVCVGRNYTRAFLSLVFKKRWRYCSSVREIQDQGIYTWGSQWDLVFCNILKELLQIFFTWSPQKSCKVRESDIVILRLPKREKRSQEVSNLFKATYLVVKLEHQP